MECSLRLQELASHNDDIRRLLEKGFALAFDSGYLIVRDVPYLDDQKQLHWGAIVTKVVFIDKTKLEGHQEDHQIFFAGSHPYGLDGQRIPNLGGGPTGLPLSEASKDVVVQRSFSNKPKTTEGTFADFFEKIQSYVTIISGPAMEMHGVTPYTFRSVDEIQTSVFKLHDTLTSRAEIGDLVAKFKDDVVLVIGLGGSGAYALDYLVKTAVAEIRAFDHDIFHVHTAFRSPGKLDEAELGKSKAEVYKTRYDNFRQGLVVEKRFIDTSAEDVTDGATFAFVCVDNGPSRAGIFDLLMSKGIPFIDIGMGLFRQDGTLNGMLRATYYSVENAKKVRDMQLADLSDRKDDLYRTTIQISELNALNASLAVMKFKQIRGFYTCEKPYFNLLMKVGNFKTAGDVGLP